MYQRLKRGIDFIMALAGLLILSPLFLVLIIAIKLDSRGPVLFRQKRVGIHKTHFNILKFRTMRTDTPKDMPTHLLKNPEQYITKVGHFLRKSSLDELPQILNILKGDMAVVGPRPALWNQYDLIQERDKYGANDVRPGLTGWAQINGRDELEIPVKAALDGEYVKKMSFLMDCRCFFGTFLSVLRGDGVVEGGTGSMAAAGCQNTVGSVQGTTGSAQSTTGSAQGTAGSGQSTVGSAQGTVGSTRSTSNTRTAAEAPSEDI